MKNSSLIQNSKLTQRKLLTGSPHDTYLVKNTLRIQNRKLTQRQNLRSSSPSDPRIAANVSQDVNIVDVCGHMRSPFHTAVLRKLLSGSPYDAPFVASERIGNHVRNLTPRPQLKSVFDSVLPDIRVLRARTCQFNAGDVTLKEVTFEGIWKNAIDVFVF